MEGQYQLELLDHTYGGQIIRQRASDGYVNATAMCKACGKEWRRYIRNEDTQQFLEALASATGKRSSDLVLTRTGGDYQTQGTWVHPQVAIHLAQWLSKDFAVKVTEWVFNWMSGLGSPASTRRGYTPDFVDRYHLNQKQVPAGYFSVISELFVVAYALIEREGYVLPEKGAHGRTVSPDISVGRLFSGWLSDNYPKLATAHIEYTHLFVDGRQIPGVRAYPNSMLGIFRDYVINVWMREHAAKYFARVDPPAVTFVEKVVAALPPPDAYPALPEPSI